MTYTRMVSAQDMPIVFNLALAEGCLLMIQEQLSARSMGPGTVLQRKARNIIQSIEEYAAMFPGSMSDADIEAVARTLQDVEDVVGKLKVKVACG